MAVDDLPAALAWAGSQQLANDLHGLVEFIDELWLAAAHYLDEPSVRTALADALASAMLLRYEIFREEDKRREFIGLVQASPARIARTGTSGANGLDWSCASQSRSASGTRSSIFASTASL